MKLHLTLGLAAGSLFATALSAAVIPYPYPGTPNSVAYSFTAANTGDVVAYFDGSTAIYTDTLGLLVNGVSTGITGLNNQSSKIGQALDLGHVNKGDSLVFFIDVTDTSSVYYSDPSLNSDGGNHIYSSLWLGTPKIPAGTFVAFEDLPASSSDFNYRDEQFVFTNLAASATPEPATVALAGTALLGLAAVRRRRARKA